MRDAAERCLAVGVFDGVHIGHRAILEGADTAVTFSVHPLSVLSPAAAPRLVTSLDERIGLIRSCGVEDVKVIEFTEETARMTATDFAAEYLGFGSGSVLTVRCGENWRFGKDAEGSPQWLRDHGIGVEVVPYASYRGEAVSSSRIRRSLAEGDVVSVNEMLARRYSVSGIPVPGKGRGRKLGFPTFNFEIDSLLRRGVYEVEVGGVKGVANYGLAPTMGDASWKRPVLEVHLLGTSAASVEGGGMLSVEFLRFIREEMKFSSPEELRRRIAADIDSVLSS